jgi:cytochrome P450
MHRDPIIFQDPDDFKPERWEEVTKDMKDASLPFGGGSRSKFYERLCVLSLLTISIVCIGLHLARIELRLGAALFFRRFPRARPSNKEGMTEEDMVMKAFFLMAPQGHRCLIEG